MRFLYSFLLIALCALPLQARNIHGDVNGDYNVNITDVTDLIDMLLRGNTSGNMAADVNNDGRIRIDDVTDLIDMLLRGDAVLYTYPDDLKMVQFYTNHALQDGTWRTTMAMGDWTRNYLGGRYWDASYWNPDDIITNMPYQWWSSDNALSMVVCWGIWSQLCIIWTRRKPHRYIRAGHQRWQLCFCWSC